MHLPVGCHLGVSPCGNRHRAFLGVHLSKGPDMLLGVNRTHVRTHTRAHTHARAHTCSLLCLLVVETGEWWRLGGAGILVPRERDLQVEVNIDK